MNITVACLSISRNVQYSIGKIYFNKIICSNFFHNFIFQTHKKNCRAEQDKKSSYIRCGISCKFCKLNYKQTNEIALENQITITYLLQILFFRIKIALTAYEVTKVKKSCVRFINYIKMDHMQKKS